MAQCDTKPMTAEEIERYSNIKPQPKIKYQWIERKYTPIQRHIQKKTSKQSY